MRAEGPRESGKTSVNREGIHDTSHLPQPIFLDKLFYIAIIYHFAKKVCIACVIKQLKSQVNFLVVDA